MRPMTYNCLAILILSVVSQISSAALMRCSNQVIKEENSVAEVKKACGAASTISKKSITTTNLLGNKGKNTSTDEIQVWIYSKTQSRLEYRVTFTNGKVTEITVH